VRPPENARLPRSYRDVFTFASLGSVPTPSGRVPGFESLASGRFLSASQGCLFVRQPRRWPQGGHFYKQKKIKKNHHQRDPGRFFDAGSPGPGGLFSKNEEVTARTSQRCHRGGRRVASEYAGRGSLWSFSESNPAALPGGCAGIAAEEISFLKRDPQGRALKIQRSYFMKFHTSNASHEV
jgi:hypothetical protein